MNDKFNEITQLLEKGQYQDASSRLSAIAPQTEHDRVEKLNIEGDLLSREGNWQAAIGKFREALELDPDHTDTLFRLAYLLDMRGDDDEAIDLYERCIDEPPAHVNALMNLAVLYEDHGRYEDALDVMESVVEQNPNNVRARLFLRDIKSSMTMLYDEDRERNREAHSAVLDVPISEFELSVRSRNCLKQMDINTIGDLLRVTEQKLLAYKNFGETSLNEIKAMLAQIGLRLGQSLEEVPSIGTDSAPAVSGDPDLSNRSVAELELSVRSRKCLQRLGVSTIGELTQKSEPELLSAKNFGQTSLLEIKRRLTEMGLSLRGGEMSAI